MDRELQVTGGYALSARAAAQESRWEASRELESKAFPAISYPGIEPGRQDGRNFVTNHVTTLERYDDGRIATDGSISGLSAAGACVSFWAGNIAGLPLHVLHDEGGVDVPFPAHPLFWLLHDSPNYDQSGFDFWEQMIEALEWRGNAFAEIERRSGDFLVSLTPIPPDAVRVKRLGNGDLEYRWVTNGQEIVRTSADILHIRGRGGTAVGGASTLATYRRALGLAATVEGSAETIFKNGVRSSGVLEADAATRFTKEQREDLENRLQDRFVGSQNAGRPMLLDGGLKWQPLSIDPVDAEMILTRRLGMEIVCQIFECDPHLVGITTGNTTLGSSIESQTLSLVKFKMHKRLRRIEGALEKQLLSRVDRKAGVKIRFNLEGFLRADSEGRATFYQTMANIGAMTINEIRALEGLPRVDGGDVPRMQTQNQPINAPAVPAAGAV